MIRPTVCQLIRVSRTVVVVSHLVISHATRSSKSRVNRAPSRANGDAFHQRAVLRAAQASEPGVDLQAPDPEIEVAPDRVVTLLALAMTRAVRALRAPQPTSPQRDRDQHPVRLKTDRADRHAGQAQQTRECARDAHRDRPPVRRTQKPRAYGLNLCASPNPTLPKLPRKQRGSCVCSSPRQNGSIEKAIERAAPQRHNPGHRRQRPQRLNDALRASPRAMIIQIRLRAGAAIPGRLSNRCAVPTQPPGTRATNSPQPAHKRARLPLPALTPECPAQGRILVQSHLRSPPEPPKKGDSGRFGGESG